MKRIIGFLATALLVIIYITACDSSPTGFTPDDDPDITQQPFGEATLGDRTRSIPTETSQRITEVSEDGTVFTFEGDDVVLSNLKQDDILIFERSEQTPFGALRKISNIQKTESSGISRYVITTEDATLEDAFENLEINTTRLQLNPADVDSIVYFVESTGMRKQLDLEEHLKNTVGNEFSHSFNIYLYGSSSDPQNSIRFSGSIEFLSELLLALELRLSGIKEITFTNENTINLDAELFAGIQQTVEQEQILFSYYFTPFAVGPVVVAPVLDLVVGVEGNASVNFRPNVEYQIFADAELKYTTGTWGFDHSFTQSMSGEMPMPEFNASLVGTIGPRLNLLIYGVAGPNATLSAYAEGIYNSQNNPQVEIYAGVRGDIGVQMRILSWEIASYSHNFLDFRNLIYSSGIELPEISTRPVTNITATSAQSGGIFESEGNQDVTQKGVCWSTSPMPDINSSCTNDGTGTSDFTSTISDLQPQTQFYVRAYAVVGDEVAYGNQLDFFTETTHNYGEISGLVLDAVSDLPIEGVDIYIQNSAGTTIGSGLSSGEGDYTISVLPGFGYTVLFFKEGYLPAEYNDVAVEPDQTTYLTQILYINEDFSGSGSISGRLIDAISGNGVPGLSLELRENINNISGTVIAQTTSNSNGSYQFDDINAGYYTISVSGDDYNSTFFNVISVGGQHTGDQNATVTPELSGEEYRIILTWGENPRDLDAHLTGPIPNGNRFHIYWANRTFTYNGEVYARLDRDVVNSFGPETITIYQQTEGVYRYSVHDFTNRSSTSSTGLSQSNAQVRLYKGNQLLNTFNVPNNQPGTLWTVFELVGSTVHPINTMSFESSSGNVNSINVTNDAELIRSVLTKPKSDD